MQHSMGKVESLLNKCSPCAPSPQEQTTVGVFGLCLWEVSIGFGVWQCGRPSPQPAAKSGMHKEAIAKVCVTQI